MNISKAISLIEQQVQNQSEGLPDELFYFISKTTPLVNVDLLIQDENGRILFAWRDDKYCGQGWHLPGGILRHKETLEERLQKTALSEIGTEVDFDPVPLTFNQFISNELNERNHFISFLYKCSLSATFVPDNKNLSTTDSGYLKWYASCPKNLLKHHEIYKTFF
ncbi:MAG: NUDIX domain-containing protein [Candidatus Gastranaerophilaceae bacterium]